MGWWIAIRAQNVGVALLTGVLIIVLTLTMKHGVGMLFEAWVPYPETPRFYCAGAFGPDQLNTVSARFFAGIAHAAG